ncbi:MAG: autotransporter outer membrane beta-barrel domain-containing protein, partial [Myxococcota bacterium]
SASVTGNEFSGYAEIGPRAFTFGQVRLRPFMGIGYAWFDSESFTESGAPAGANLSVDSGSYQSLELGPGLLADQVIDLGPGFKLRAELRARYTHEFLDTNPKLDASISGSAFEVQGKSPGRHVGLLGASLEFIDRGGVTTYLSYDFRGNTDMLEHTASAGIQVRF